MNWSAAIAVGLVLAVLWFIEKQLGTPMVIRPIVVSPLVGLVLGDVTAGVLMGASLELIFMGAIQIGGSIPPDVLVGAGLGTAFAILSKQGPEIAVALGLPISILAQSIKALIFIIRSGMMENALKMAENNNVRGMKALNLGGLFLQCLMYFAVAFVAILFGSEAIAGFLQSIPASIMSALTNIGRLLPAVGFALLLQPMMEAKNAIYFLLGFVLLVYLKLPVIAITLIGLAIAYIVVFERGKANTAAKDPALATASDAGVQDGNWEDLFNE